MTRADHPRALEPEKIIETVNSGSVRRPSPNQRSALNMEMEIVVPIETALTRALEIAQNNGSIVLSAGSMLVTAEVKNGFLKRISR